MNAEPETVDFRNAPEEDAYVVDVNGQRAGKAVYHIRGGRHLFVHTEIDPAYSGRGLGTQLVHYALEDVRMKGGTFVPICPFFAAYFERHPEYEDIVDREMFDRINSRLRKD